MSRPLALLALLLALPLVNASALVAPSPAAPPASVDDTCVGIATARCIDLPLVVDEGGDTITGPLVLDGEVTVNNRFSAPAIQLPSGTLSSTGSSLTFNGALVCQSFVGLAGFSSLYSVFAGPGLTGGGTSGHIGLAVDPARTQSRVVGACPAGQSIRTIAQDGSVACEVDDVGVVLAGAGLALAGSTLSIAPGGVTSAMVQDAALQQADLGFDVATQAELNALRVTSAMVEDGTLQQADLGFDVATQAELDGLDLPWARNTSAFKFPVAVTGTKTVATLQLEPCSEYLVSAGGSVQDNDLAATSGSIRIFAPALVSPFPPFADSQASPTERWFSLTGGVSASAPDYDSFHTSRVVQTAGTPLEVRLEASAVSGGYSVFRWELTALRIGNDC